MLAGAGTGVTSNGSEAIEMGLVLSKQPGTADHCHRGQHKCRAAQHVRLYSCTTMHIAQVWCSLDLYSTYMLQMKAYRHIQEEEVAPVARLPGAGTNKGKLFLEHVQNAYFEQQAPLLAE